ncbi:YutD family protein [Weissella ceti]|uniref:YutD family protein n=1 Tax=Weissella ceti TaxID=759620 RepID=A0ABT3E2A6_9LACO|nr:YutD family protein [Weissella ceti]MCW0952549.1 YutD family protein [Weissella ceti]QVK11785.1 YutD family protein [Weissella ceti]
MNRERMKELAEAQFAERQAATQIVHAPDDFDKLQINERSYKLVVNYREAYDDAKLAARFSEFLEKYNFIVGDIAADQLRLRGFYNKGITGIPRNQQITALEDYLYEEVNFGAPYFVLENLEPHDVPEEVDAGEGTKRRHRSRRRPGFGNKSKDKGAAIKETQRPVQNKKPTGGKNTEVKVKGARKKRHFEVRDRKTDKPNVTKGK